MLFSFLEENFVFCFNHYDQKKIIKKEEDKTPWRSEARGSKACSTRSEGLNMWPETLGLGLKNKQWAQQLLGNGLHFILVISRGA